MTRQEKFAGLIVGILLFGGISFLIYDAFLKDSLETDYAAEGLEDIEDLPPEVEGDVEPGEEDLGQEESEPGETEGEELDEEAEPAAPARPAR